MPRLWTRPLAHPRSRGEHLRGADLGSECSGSSPLARGTRIGEMPGRASNRLIPARAGNTLSAALKCLMQTAHPRSRGEHVRVTNVGTGESGSSPLARGTPSHQEHFHGGGRLIPARAGNTRAPICPALARAAHPRSRGEHIFQRSLAAGHFGSSPLARGTRESVRKAVNVARLIPARAGNTITLDVAPNVTPAHPRSRGEHAW